MGCCVSVNKASEFDKVGSNSLNPRSTLENRAPPPSSLGEETTKEVLAETETPNHKPPLQQQQLIKINNLQEYKDEINVEAHVPGLDQNTKERAMYKNDVQLCQEDDEISEQVSEVCSVSLSASTVNNTKTDDDVEEVKLRVVGSSAPKSHSRNRTFSGDKIGPRKDRPVRNPPTRRVDSSPVKRNNAGLVQSRRVAERRGFRPNQNRKSPGESSGRTSRSPAVNRSAATMRTKPSPGGVIKDPAKNVDNGMNTDSNGGHECLENPHVSLECFIFL
ncbi:hypothetical protein K2173_001676 [Erythroxylum novogranatense]|uniref:Uncharacterized protein n=1 Tax=Erythroxylum novogranatense TaxID=1862640 RepID=A0AAV8T466_9ROSI|nr:hypothetical protein K2173_001676 [Erythroxylum novogranatense]